MTRLEHIIVALVGVAFAAGMGCSSSSSPAGVEGGKCYPNGTCNAGLACVSSACVRMEGGAPIGTAGAGGAAAGTAGAAGSSAGGSSAAAGTAGSGEQRDGGSAGAGAAGATGAGGATGVAGSKADGGPQDRPTSTDVSDGPTGMEVSLVPRASCPAGPFAAAHVAASASVCSGSILRYGFTAGPVWVASENAFFFSAFPQSPVGGSDLGDIVKYTPGVGCQVVFQDVGTNGLTVAPDGRLIGASFKTRTISEFDLSTGKPKVLVDKAMGLPLDTPVDVRVHSNGTIYFSNQSTDVAGSGRALNGVYRVDTTGTVLSVSFTASDVAAWDGYLALSPDEKSLIIAGVGGWELDGAGVPTTNHFGTPLDGRLYGAAAFDCAGNVYIVGWPSEGFVYSPSFQNIPGSGGIDEAAGVAFGGADGKILFNVNHSFIRAATTTIPGTP